MTRGTAPNNHYNYELIKAGEHKYFRTSHCLGEYLGVSNTTILNKIKKPTLVIRKYKNEVIEILKVKVPIYEKIIIKY